MARIDYYKDSKAPSANRIVVAANAFVQDDQGRVLFIQRSDNGLWALPGGTQEVGETVAAAAERETYEETGYRVRVTGLIGIYSDPTHVIAYDDGEIRQEFALSFRAALVAGEARVSSESLAVEWVSQDNLDARPMEPWILLRVNHGFQRSRIPYVGWARPPRRRRSGGAVGFGP